MSRTSRHSIKLYARFGCEHVEAALVAQNRRIVVIDPDEMRDDIVDIMHIVRDMTEVLTSMCARLYGKRSAPFLGGCGVSHF
jgi:putative resolvase